MAQVSTSNVERSSDDGRSEFVVVANRLPVRHEDDGSWTLSPGGLVSAMLPVMRERTGAWVGWDGTADGTDDSFEFEGIQLRTVGLSQRDHDEYYSGACNETIWPLYHGSIEAAQFHPSAGRAVVGSRAPRRCRPRPARRRRRRRSAG